MCRGHLPEPTRPGAPSADGSSLLPSGGAIHRHLAQRAVSW